MIYFTSDLHFHHKNIIKSLSKWDKNTSCLRNFSSIEEMNFTLINKYFSDEYLIPLEHIYYYANAILTRRDYFFLRNTKLYDYILLTFLKKCNYNFNTFRKFSYRTYYSKEVWKELLIKCGIVVIKFIPKKFLTKEMYNFMYDLFGEKLFSLNEKEINHNKDYIRSIIFNRK